jgi:hypothetical protein
MVKRCLMCPAEFEAKRASAKYCSPRCRMRASRAGVAGGRSVPVRPDGPQSDAVECVTRAELAQVGQVDSSSGQCALALARRIDAGMESGAGLAALVREHRNAMADALGGADLEVSPLDQLRQRRERRLIDALLDGDAG